MLEQQQQQQQFDPHLASAVMGLAAAELNVVEVLAIMWPSGSNSSSSNRHSWFSSSTPLSNVALPAAHLAAAVLANSADQHDVRWAVKVAMQLCQGLVDELEGADDSAASGASDMVLLPAAGSQDSPALPLQQLLRSTELLQLLAATHALHVQHLACRLCSSSSSSSSSSVSSSSSSSSGGGSGSDGNGGHCRSRNGSQE
uniref:Uncharacterized protein n=1 Tax=Tetradesmus obliquus TaxID=3088 RepID=A0A383W645_TETOB